MESHKEAEWLYILLVVCMSSVLYLLLMILMALKTAISGTHISPKTASHMVAMPVKQKEDFSPVQCLYFKQEFLTIRIK
jgi:hypothetical protein